MQIELTKEQRKYQEIRNEYKKIPWYVDWFAEWLCLIQTLCMILTFCKLNPQLEWNFLIWHNKRTDKKVKEKYQEVKEECQKLKEKS